MPTLPDNSGLSFKLVLNTVSELLVWLSPWPGLIQIFACPSRQTVTMDSLVNIKPERGSACTRWTTTGESFGTSRMLGAGWRVPTGQMLSQWEDWLPLLNVGDPPGGHRRKGTTISSITKSHKSNWVSWKKKKETKKKKKNNTTQQQQQWNILLKGRTAYKTPWM